MTGTSHRLGGVLAGLATIALMKTPDIQTQGIILASAVIGSLLPDIDNAQSSISYKIPLVRGIVGLFQGAIKLLAGLLPKKQERFIRSAIGHRGITHSLVFALIMPGIIIIFGHMFSNLYIFPAALGMMVGILSHILLDLFSNGVPLFLPFSNKRTTGARIKTGGVAEWLIRIVIIYIALVIVGPWFNDLMATYNISF